MLVKYFIPSVLMLGSLVTLVGCQPQLPPNPVLTASFTMQRDSTCTAPCSVTFVNTSQLATAYRWDFGDGSTSAEQNPVHLYTKTISYLVSLTAISQTDSQTYKDSIRVGSPILWHKVYGSSEKEVLTVILPTSDGGYMLAGQYRIDITNDPTTAPAGLADYLVVKIDATGRELWKKTYGGNRSDFLYTAIHTNDGGFLLCGDSNSDISGDRTVIHSRKEDVSDVWLIKIDQNGVKQWDRAYDYPIYSIKTLIETPDNGFLLGSETNSTRFPNKLNGDFFIAKLNARGEKEWEKAYGGTDSEALNSIANAPDGGFLLAGDSYSNSSGDKSEKSRGKTDYWVVKVDSQGNRQWDKTYGGEGQDFLSIVRATPDGGYLLGGTSESYKSGDKSDLLITYPYDSPKGDFWIVKLDATGQKQWDKAYGKEPGLSYKTSCFVMN